MILYEIFYTYEFNQEQKTDRAYYMSENEKLTAPELAEILTWRYKTVSKKAVANLKVINFKQHKKEVFLSNV